MLREAQHIEESATHCDKRNTLRQAQNFATSATHSGKRKTLRQHIDARATH